METKAEALVRDFPEYAHFEEDGTLVIERLDELQAKISHETVESYGQTIRAQLNGRRRHEAQVAAKKKAARKRSAASRKRSR